MIFSVKNCSPSQYGDESNEFRALSNLLRSHGDRNNLVFFDKNTIRDIINSPMFCKIDRCIAVDIFDTMSEYQQLLNLFDIIVEIDFCYSGCNIISQGDKSVIKLDTSYFNLFTSVNPVVFLAENSLDIDVYLKMGGFYVKEYGINTRITFDGRSGGGSQVKRIYDSLKNSDLFCLCIVDNDKKHPSGSEGSTSAQFSIHDRGLNGKTFVKILDVHEIECLLPLNIIETVLREENYSSEYIDNYDLLARIARNNPELRLFLDHKNGISLKKAIELDSVYGPFYLDAFNHYNGFKNKDCISEKECSDCGNCLEVKGFGENLLKNFVKHINEVNIKALNVDKGGYPYWIEIGKLVANWGCAFPSRKARS
ncbi:hypothetical protein [Thiothrix unzii]|uniref:Uncharacterized protein n=1 Tax=Thiothrix unzii TaxID=111769 RepID=A0A975FB37_9GAMM|nr:hypothetical protein [Thiothrix unzii]QTR54557.1 hypothetical protein J9260_05575 [Thiothrix unzii]